MVALLATHFVLLEAGVSLTKNSKTRFATAALFHGFPATLIAAVLCVTRQTAYHYKSGIRKPSATALRLWTLYHNGRILGDEWDGWHARDAVLFDPEGHRTTQPQLRAYAYVWELARELARGDAIATEALDGYASLARARLTKQRRREVRNGEEESVRSHGRRASGAEGSRQGKAGCANT